MHINISGSAGNIILALPPIADTRPVGVPVRTHRCSLGFGRGSSARPPLCGHSILGASGATRCGICLVGLRKRNGFHVTLARFVWATAGDTHVSPRALPPHRRSPRTGWLAALTSRGLAANAEKLTELAKRA